MSSPPPLPASPDPDSSPSTPPAGSAKNDEIADDASNADLPLPLAASVILTTLPQDSKTALEGAGDLDIEKVTVKFHALSSAPRLTASKFKISASQPFATVVRSLRRKLRLSDAESVFCYVGSCFAPGLDEGVGNLWRCFQVGGELVVGYAVARSFG